MTGVTVTPAPTGTMAGVDKFTGQTQSASSANSQRIASVAERLDAILHAGHLSREMGIFNLCLALSRGIDYAIANNEVPLKADQLPLLLKKMCQCRNVHALQAAIMVLMISVKPGFIMGLQRVGLVPPGALDKNACMFKWFSDKDTEELLALVNEIGRSFSISDVNTESDHFLPIVSKIMARFYPRMKMGKILVSLEVKPGYGAYSVDFHILKDGTFSSREKIWLFVAQTDDIETSSCIVSPSQVSFLLNGKGVEKRTNVLMDTGPQIPTNVTGMLKYGTNILQAVGQFNGHYIIAIAIMSVTSCPDTTKLHDFVQPVVATLDSDSEIIEGPSRISLKCPMSFSRIKTPVKGHLCKHLQCFDFDNFVEINSRRPSWRCPHCNQYVCYSDIRIDQNMVKILREVDENVAEVIISADGSWKAVLESNDHGDQSPHYEIHGHLQEGSEQRESTTFSNSFANVLDLTEGSDEMDVVVIPDMEDRKPFQANTQIHSFATNPTMSSELINTSEANQITASRVEDDFRSGALLSTYSSATPITRSDHPIVDGISDPFGSSSRMSPVLTDAVSPALNRVPEEPCGSHLTASFLQSQLSFPNNMWQSQFGDSFVSNEHGRFPHYNISRTPVAVQALPAQSMVPQQRSRTSLNPFGSHVSSSVVPTTNSIQAFSEMQQHFSRSVMNPLQLPEVGPSLLQNHSMTQNWDQTVQQVASQPPIGYRHSLGLPTEQQRPPNQRMNQNISQSPNLMRSSAQLPWTQNQQDGVGHLSATHLLASAQRTSQNALQSHPVPVQTMRTGPVNAERVRSSAGRVQTLSRADDMVDLTSEPNWQPQGRMRGSITGRPFSADLEPYIIQPTQPSNPTSRPPPNPTLAPSTAP